MNRARKQQFELTVRPIHSSPFQQQRLREAITETRLEALTMFVENLEHAAYAVLLSEQSSAQEVVEELCVKESALRWMARAAKHSEGVVRERLWKDIERAVGDLEALARSISESKKVIPFENSGSLRRGVAGAAGKIRHKTNFQSHSQEFSLHSRRN